LTHFFNCFFFLFDSRAFEVRQNKTFIPKKSGYIIYYFIYKEKFIWSQIYILFFNTKLVAEYDLAKRLYNLGTARLFFVFPTLFSPWIIFSVKLLQTDCLYILKTHSAQLNPVKSGGFKKKRKEIKKCFSYILTVDCCQKMEISTKKYDNLLKINKIQLFW
jgi:hypothetical protein